MTNEEISKWLMNLKNDIGKTQYQPLWHYAEALDMAIEALQRGLENVNADSCSEKPNGSDVISRQDAIYYVKQATIGETDVMKAWVKAQTHLMRLPSAQPEDVIHITGRRKFVSEFDFDEDEPERDCESCVFAPFKQFQPERKKGEWIPVSERLPDEGKDVLLTYKNNMVVGNWENICGEVTWYANSGDGWFTAMESVDNDGIPIAWMPLPEPYRGDK